MTGRAFVDLHCHTSASFDSLASPASIVRAAAARGLTHLAITDHERIDGAVAARDAAPAGLTVIVGEEVRTAEGDLICLFLDRAIPPGLPAAETIELVRAQGGLVGIPHPFDRFRGSLLRDERMESLAAAVDWIESHNARVVGSASNERAAAFAVEHSLPGVAVSDAHSVIEVGISYTVLDGDPGTPAGLLAALETVRLVPGRASYVARAFMPVAKLVNRVRRNRRIGPTANDADRRDRGDRPEADRRPGERR
ncbi:MAG TPA: PHP domain-containing protein [Candidatus Limnocylindrales bacterium]